MSIGRLTAAVVAVGKAMDDTSKKADALGEQLADLADADSLSGISENLRRLFAAEDVQGNPFSARFDEETGRMTGGAFSDKYIADLFKALAESMIATEGLTTTEMFRRNINPTLLARDRADSIAYIKEIAGKRFGDVEKTLKELIAAIKRMSEKDAQQSRTSTTTARTPTPAPTTSLMVIQKLGGLR